MKQSSYSSKLSVVSSHVAIIFLCVLVFSSCQEEPKLWELKSTELVASDYIKTKPEYAEFAKLIEMTGLNPLLGIKGPNTVHIPDNDAMMAYHKKRPKIIS